MKTILSTLLAIALAACGGGGDPYLAPKCETVSTAKLGGGEASCYDQTQKAQ